MIVIAVCEHLTAPAHELVEALGEPNAETLHAPCEGATIKGLDEEVQVVALDRERADAHAESLGGGLTDAQSIPASDWID